jgi:hypothetical protein
MIIEFSSFGEKTMSNKDLAVLDNVTGEVVPVATVLPIDLKDVILTPGNVLVQTGLDQEAYMRVSYDTKAGLWHSELYGDETQTDFEMELRAVLFTYARWGEQVGRPKCYHIGVIEDCEYMAQEHEKGVRVYFFNPLWGEGYADMFGMMYRVGQGLVKLAMKGQTVVNFVGSREADTRNGKFQLPKIARD